MYIPTVSGCVRIATDEPFGDLESGTNLQSMSTCQAKCQEHPQCTQVAILFTTKALVFTIVSGSDCRLVVLPWLKLH